MHDSLHATIGCHLIGGVGMHSDGLEVVRISRRVAEKIWRKHGATEEEVLDVFENENAPPQIRRSHRAAGSYVALGRTPAGRYLAVAFYPKTGGLRSVATARDMTDAERRLHDRK